MNAEQRARILSLPGARTICDFLVNIGNRGYAKTAASRDMLLTEMQSSRRSKRCFIVGNGPSLKVSDLDRLADEDCFAANHIYKLFDQTRWRPKYYVLQDRYTVMDRPLESIEAQYLFLGSYFLRCNHFEVPENAYVFYDRRDLGRGNRYLSFSDDVRRYISVNYTVTYSMMQIAASLGYREVYLLGLDHTYSVETDDKGVVIQRNNVMNHAYEDVNKEIVANVRGMERAYESAKHYSDSRDNFRIANATRGGRLEVFDRVDLGELLQ